MDNKKLIDLSYINETLSGDQTFLKEFCEAAVLSFSEFKVNFGKYLIDRNETELRKAGHKIKPVAQMLKVDPILDEYEHAKVLIIGNRDDDELQKSAKKMDSICAMVLSELKETIENK